MTAAFQFFLMLLCLVDTTMASDQQRELDYAAAIEKNTPKAQVVWLEAEQKRFLALFSETERTANTQAAIILHGQGEHPDISPLIHGLRLELPQHQWATLAIQLPVLERGAPVADYFSLFEQAQERILSAVKFLQEKGANSIVLIGYDYGAAMAAFTLNNQPKGISGWVALSLPVPDSPLPQAQIGQFMQKIALPLLDIYAEFDLPEVLQTARQRRLSAKDNPGYRQIQIDGEDHRYENDPALLIKRVYSGLSYMLNH